MSAQRYETIESLVPQSWVKRMDAFALRHEVTRDSAIAHAVKVFLQYHKQLKGKAKK